MKVLQVLTTISFGDAVSNDTLALQDVLKEMGYETGIYAENIDARLPKNTAQKIQKASGAKVAGCGDLPSFYRNGPEL
ncbi:MAG: hypothetical protein V8S32_02805 [Lachnospiraceae bacterium]